MSQEEESERDRGRQTEGGDTPILSETVKVGHVLVRNGRRKIELEILETRKARLTPLRE